LGLKPGEGLTVNFVAPDSPAAKAAFHTNDVLVELDGQMLVHPLQLRKLIQMHAEGDTIKLAFYRGGTRQTSSVKLGKNNLELASDKEEGSWPGYLKAF
jgi:serine protease Do